MKFLRSAPTGRLLAVIVGLLVAVGGGTAIALAAGGGGPVPKSEPLATAVHGALSAPAVTGISADISFTNNLIGASALSGTPASDPILAGATGRLWLSDHRLRLELQSDNGDAQVLVNGSSFSISDPASHTVYEGTLPAGASSRSGSAAGKGHAADAIPTVAQIQSQLGKLMAHVDLSGAIPSDVGGQPAYTVRVSPKHAGGLLGAAAVAWDAIRGVPLRFAIYARNNPTPVLELKATNISYGHVAASVFNVSPPAGSKVVKISPPAQAKPGGQEQRKRGHRAQVTGVAAVAAKLPFTLTAPSSLVGLPRHTVSLLDWGGQPAALVTYGQNLGGIAVVERSQSSAAKGWTGYAPLAHPAGAANSSSQAGGTSSSGAPSGLTLPTVSINGATGHELDTALGTVITFSRGGVDYTVLGSVPSAAADAAARAL